jgi:hypothetical protein
MNPDEPHDEFGPRREGGDGSHGDGQQIPLMHEEVRVHEEAVSRDLVLRVLIGAIVITVVLCFVAYLLLRTREAQLRPDGRFPERAFGPPHEVATVLATPYELPKQTEMADRQRTRLQHYGWADETRGRVHIPIERAIDLLVGKKGRP